MTAPNGVSVIVSLLFLNFFFFIIIIFFREKNKHKKDQAKLVSNIDDNDFLGFVSGRMFSLLLYILLYILFVVPFWHLISLSLSLCVMACVLFFSCCAVLCFSFTTTTRKKEIHWCVLRCVSCLVIHPTNR